MGLVIHIDGGSRGNPGPAGAGVVIQSDAGLLVHEGAYFLGTQTNNAAEYYAVIRALERLSKMPPEGVAFRSDSELLVRQITGQYQVKSPSLARLFGQVQRLLLRVGTWQFRHIPRAENRRADELANMAMDVKKDVIVFDAEGMDPAAQQSRAVLSEPAVESKPSASPPPRSAGPSAKPVAGSSAMCPRVRVAAAKAPAPDGCPARGLGTNSLSIGAEMPAGVCVHAAQAIIPTLIGVQNTDPSEFAAVPTLTVRCGRPGCGATFHVGPEPSSNGVHA